MTRCQSEPAPARPGECNAVERGAAGRAEPWLLRIAPLLAAAALACGPAAHAPSPEAEACGQLVRFYLGLHAPVEVTAFEAESDTGKVRIDYRSSDDLNIPVEGVSLCRFEAGPGGALEAKAAFVDENRLTDEEIAGFNASRTSS